MLHEWEKARRLTYFNEENVLISNKFDLNIRKMLNSRKFD